MSDLFQIAIKFSLIATVYIVQIGCMTSSSEPVASKQSFDRGQPFNYDKLFEIKNNASTIDDVNRILGPPFRVGKNMATENPIYIYAYLGSNYGQQVIIEFDKEGKVLDLKGNRDIIGSVVLDVYSGGTGSVTSGTSTNIYAYQMNMSGVAFSDIDSLRRYVSTLQLPE